MTPPDEHLRVFLIDDPETLEEERRDMEAHLRGCEACRRSLESYRRARNLLLSAEAPAESEAFLGRVLRKTTGGPDSSVPLPRPFWTSQAPLWVAALSLFAAVFFLMRSPATTTVDLLGAGESGAFFQWADASGRPSEDEVLKFVLEGD